MIFELLNKGKDNAISSKNLENVLQLSTRELHAQIERERREGKPIMAKRDNGGGLYLPGSEEEKEEYLNKKKNEVITILETCLSVKYGKKKTLDKRQSEFIKGL